ncbi:MAG: sigma-70 family RNA polymerase sigma factor [Deltaproteobacteria bacterium]|nr:sigma-70 family RNA polymerase sigma factor [Deltaproteobacteria bacterium]
MAAYERYGHLVLRRCRFILRDEQLAEDALHEVFVKVMKYGESLLDADAPVRWLYRVAERVCFDQLKKRPAKQEVEMIEQDTAGRGADPAAEVSDRELLVKFLDHFDKKTRRLVLLYHLDGYSQDQIARETGWSRQTVHKKLARVHEKAESLRRSLGIA